MLKKIIKNYYLSNKMQSNKTENCVSSCLLDCLKDDEINRKIIDECMRKDEPEKIITRIKRNSQSNGMYISVELLNEETTERLSQDLKKKYILTKREVSIDSVFNNSQILVSELHVSEKHISDNDNSYNFRSSGIKRVPSYSVIF